MICQKAVILFLIPLFSSVDASNRNRIPNFMKLINLLSVEIAGHFRDLGSLAKEHSISATDTPQGT